VRWERAPGVTAVAPESGADEPGRKPKHDPVEIVATVLLSLAAVATAWSGYQASRWHGEQAKATSKTTAVEINAARAQGLAEAETEVDVAVFTQWVNADVGGDVPLADFYRQRFRDEFKPAFEAWIATEPFTNTNAPPSPFAMPEYRLAAAEQAEEFDRETNESRAEVQRNIQRADNYVLGVVLFAAALFFAGMSTKLHTPAARKILLVVGIALFLGAAVWIATFPVSVEV
jgi:hypothetical protein